MSWVITPAYLGAAVSDADAQAYLRAVEAADNQGPLEQGVQQAVNQFVIGCKADGIWTAIKASCILAGARTLNGALVPLVGTAPTNVGPFVSGDYNRKTGLVGNGSTKYLDSNRNNNIDSQDNRHLCVYASTTPAASNGGYIGAGGSDAGASGLGYVRDTASPFIYARINSSGDLRLEPPASYTGLIGASRSTSSTQQQRAGGSGTTGSLNSQVPFNGNTFVFARSGSSLFPGAARLAFYSIGEALDLARLDARVTTLVNAFAAAIP
jgi:hypothetical protein